MINIWIFVFMYLFACDPHGRKLYNECLDSKQSYSECESNLDFEVIKPIRWGGNSPPFGIVCTNTGIKMSDIEQAKKYMPESVDILFGESNNCTCSGTLEGSVIIPDGLMEIFTGPTPPGRAGRAVVGYTQDGDISGACVLTQRNPMVVAHELSHACGNKHALNKKSKRSIIGHLMSDSEDIIGRDTTGMYFNCNEKSPGEWFITDNGWEKF